MLIASTIATTVEALLTGSCLQLVYTCFTQPKRDSRLRRIGVLWVLSLAIVQLITWSSSNIKIIIYRQKILQILLIDFVSDLPDIPVHSTFRPDQVWIVCATHLSCPFHINRHPNHDLLPSQGLPHVGSKQVDFGCHWFLHRRSDRLGNGVVTQNSPDKLISTDNSFLQLSRRLVCSMGYWGTND